MIDFILKLKNTAQNNYLKDLSVRIEREKETDTKENIELILPETTRYSRINFINRVVYIIGDLIIGEETNPEELFSGDIHPLIRDLKGFFYIIEIKKNNINIFSSVFNILPIFYYSDNKKIIISSKAFLIKESIDLNLKLNKRFILEQKLFNHSFFNETIYKEIKTLPSNSYIHISNNDLNIIKHTKIEEYFTNEPVSWRESIDEMADLFFSGVKMYFPDTEFYLTFTGGFDGRTLVACAKKFHKRFKTFSFGASDNTDLTIPMDQSKKLGIDFLPIYLEKEYIEKYFWEHGLELLKISDCNSNFLQVHFFSAAKVVAKHTKYLLNGMFGSELMRALHISGQVTSRSLVDFFLYDDEKEWIEKIKNSDTLNYLNINNFKNEMDGLIEDLIEYKRGLNKHLTRNHHFYKFIFEEAFSKFFGTQIASQMQYVKVRSPFLDFKFISEFLKTELAGANNDFFTHNPLKRYKGQLFYAKIIEKSFKLLLNLKNDKGYKPGDLINSLGILNITYGYLKKRIKKKLSPPIVDNLRIVSGMKQNMNLFRSVNLNTDIFNKNFINDMFDSEWWLKDRDKFIEAISTNYFINEIF